MNEKIRGSPYFFRRYCAKYRKNEHLLLIFRGEPEASFTKVESNIYARQIGANEKYNISPKLEVLSLVFLYLIWFCLELQFLPNFN